eukprot:TRINITY_DN7549_c0_g2_i2.p1 TRINITY_DN7549_c0_g2~~TRINITY_DN7549_c0_g2_i2.p1  ORF type:complete len:297 (-),score=14.51 TRINITY_DN7549_c0_g2_i2:504-1313(-)
MSKFFSPLKQSDESNSFQLLQIDTSQPSRETTQSGQKRKRRCNCRSSKCLKLYCECFAAGNYCEDCTCLNCENNAQNETVRAVAVQSVLQRNPWAFLPKNQNIKSQKGCNCKRSFCLKKYCECFLEGVPCSERCGCKDCQNCTSTLSSPDSQQQSPGTKTAGLVSSSRKRVIQDEDIKQLVQRLGTAYRNQRNRILEVLKQSNGVEISTILTDRVLQQLKSVMKGVLLYEASQFMQQLVNQKQQSSSEQQIRTSNANGHANGIASVFHE